MMKQIALVVALVASASAFAPASRAFVQQTALQAEWAPPDGTKWVEKDFEAEIKKLESEAEERLDAKIAEMMSNVEKTGKSD